MSVARGKATDFSCVTMKNMTMKGANFLEKLLDNQPVEWKKLGEVAENLDNLRRPVTGNNRVAGEYPYYGASGIVDYVDNYIFDGDYLLISEDGANLTARKTPIAFSISGKNWVNNHAHVLKFETYVERKFVEYYLNNLDISEYVSGAAQPKLNQANLNRIPIPLPPLSVQSRIVEMLDKFTSLEAELEAELELRKKQYAYYREQLLNFSYTPPSEFNVVYKKLGEVCELVTDFTAAGSFASNAKNVKYLNNPDFALLVRTTDLKQKFQNEDRFIYVDKKAYEYLWRVKLDVESIIMPNVGNCGEVYFVSPEQLPYSHCVLGPNALLIRSNIANQKFLFYLFHSADFQAKLSKITSSTGQTKFNKTNLKQLPIPLPPLSEQARIVEILDKFDTLTNSISEGLPLEIQLRKQQYEYYREQLLAFPHP